MPSPKAIPVLLGAFVIAVVGFAWITADLFSGDLRERAVEAYPGAPWWKYNPDAEIATVYFDGSTGFEVAGGLEGLGITIVETYRNEALAALKTGEHQHLEQLGYEVFTYENRTVSGGGAFTFDTLYGEPAIPLELRVNRILSPDYDFFILQFVGNIKEEWKVSIESRGIPFLNYLTPNSVVVKMSPSQEASLMRLDYVQWIGIYQPAYKISADLLPSTESWHILGVSMLKISGSSDLKRVMRTALDVGGRILYLWEDYGLNSGFEAFVPHSIVTKLAQDPQVFQVTLYSDISWPLCQ